MIYLGNPDEGAGSDVPGCVAELGSEASIDSSLPRSTLASSSSGCFFTLSSSSRSGSAESVGAGAFSFFSRSVFWSVTDVPSDFRFRTQNERAGRAFRCVGPFVRPIGGAGLPTDERAIVVSVEESLLELGHDRTFDLFTAGPLCRLAARHPVDHRFLGLLSRDRPAARVAGARSGVGNRLSRSQCRAWPHPHLPYLCRHPVAHAGGQHQAYGDR